MSIIFQTGHELSIVLGDESTSASARVRFPSTMNEWKIVYIIWTTTCIRRTTPWTNFGNLAPNRKKKLTQKSKKMFPTTQKRHVSPFGSNSQGCINLLKIIAEITSGITDTISTSRSNFLNPWSQMCKIVFLLVHF
jgi:hypothetical protein